MNYVQFTDDQRRQMLDACGAGDIDDLLKQVPDDIRLPVDGLKLPAGMDEWSLKRHLSALAGRNRPVSKQVCFLGAGAYDHFIPATVDALANKAEFLTAYTPYQPEASQGSLQAFFEFQTMVCQLTGMDVANASLYEGATALAEAALMALNVTGKRRILVSAAIHPHFRAVLKTYLSDPPAEYVEIPLNHGVTDLAALDAALVADTAAVLVQSPNFYGCIEPVARIAERSHQNQSLCVQLFNPISLGLLKRPGELGVDVAVAEGQPLGIPLGFGGPYLGLFAVRQEFVRKIPGRLVGQTTDLDGKRAFCLTLQTREQHIRREKATSNVCTNQGLLAMRASVYLATMGPAGLRDVAQLCFNKTAYLVARLRDVGVALKYPGQPFFNEVLVKLDHPVEQVLAAGRDAGILAGYPVGRDDPSLRACLLVAVTEQRTRPEIDNLVELLAAGSSTGRRQHTAHDAANFVTRDLGGE